MKASTTVARLAGYLSWIIAFILVLLPFHAFLTVWASSLVGHYTLLRLWKELLLVPALIGALFILIKDKPLRRGLSVSPLIRLIIAYIALMLVCGAVAFARNAVTGKALAYGLLVDLRFLGFFLIVLVVAARSTVLRFNWRRLLLAPAALVAVFGILQYWFLPYDFLKHFGYGPATIGPYETINNNINFIRIESTLRGANPLGAYLVLVVSALVAGLSRLKKKLSKEALLLPGVLLALVFCYSRSAWIGTFLAVAIIAWVRINSAVLRRQILIILGIVVVVGAVAAIALRHNTALQDAFLHTDNKSQAAASSNEGHSAAFKNGIHDIVHQPLGEGPGTAGPASIYNSQPTRIAEDYFLQIGQEAGILGMALFIAINLMAGRMLWARRSEPLALALFASLIGLSFVNLLSHAWTDDTLAYIWWGLAAIALGPAILKANKTANEKTRQKTA